VHAGGWNINWVGVSTVHVARMVWLLLQEWYGCCWYAMCKCTCMHAVLA
jgi:hypothetical protein